MADNARAALAKTLFVERVRFTAWHATAHTLGGRERFRARLCFWLQTALSWDFSP
ncbi:MAG TPA: hypothetical protein VHV55_03380 [Pirellulales bacterium]|jgi:hypothetical protein|nr:hypothetical protein [Pirellulales bacterium]